jgi:hypothetical protein
VNSPGDPEAASRTPAGFRVLATAERDAFFAACFQALEADGGDGGIYWAAYHDAYPDYDGFGVYYPADSTTAALVTAFAEDITTPPGPGPSLVLGAPYPNPFTGSLFLSFTIPESGVPGGPLPGAPVHAAVYDLQGRQVRHLYDGHPGAGETVVPWSGLDRQGIPVPPGVYFLRVWTAGHDWTRKAVKLRE